MWAQMSAPHDKNPIRQYEMWTQVAEAEQVQYIKVREPRGSNSREEVNPQAGVRKVVAEVARINVAEPVIEILYSPGSDGPGPEKFHYYSFLLLTFTSATLQ
jgi:hypothetical protein